MQLQVIFPTIFLVTRVFQCRFAALLFKFSFRFSLIKKLPPTGHRRHSGRAAVPLVPAGCLPYRTVPIVKTQGAWDCKGKGKGTARGYEVCPILIQYCTCRALGLY